MTPEELTNKATLSNEDMEIILSAFSLLEFPNYNINPRDVDYAFLYQVDKLEKTFHREPIELQRRKENLLEKCRICSAAAKRPNLFNEILEYKKREIKADSHFIPFKHFKDFFINLWSDLKIFKYRVFDKPFQFFTHISVLTISFGKNLIILFVKNGWEFLYSLFTSPALTLWINKNWKTQLFTNLIAALISCVLFILPIYFLKVGYENLKEFWNDQITDVENLPKEDLKGYIPKNYILAKDKIGETENIAIPFGTEIEYRKVKIGQNEFAYYIPRIDSYIFNEEIASSAPSIVASKLFTLMEEENQYIPIQNYTKKIPTRKIELFSGSFRIFDVTGRREVEGIYDINKDYISLDSKEFHAKLRYNKNGSFFYSTTIMR